MKISGIYKIINKVNGKYYVGSSDDFYRRTYHHKNDLSKNNHSNEKLQRAWNKYGNINFDFVIIEKTSKENLLFMEQLYLNICKENPNSNYNISYDAIAPMRGRNHTESSKIKIGVSNIGKHNKSKEEKIIQSNRMKGRFLGKNNPMFGKGKWGPDNPMFGRHHTDQSNEKNRKSHIGRYVGCKNPNYGKITSDSTKEKISMSQRDHSIYILKNKISGEDFIGTRNDFRKKTNSTRQIIYLILKNNKTYKGWGIGQ